MKKAKASAFTIQGMMHSKTVDRYLSLLTIFIILCPLLGYADADPVTKLEYVFSEPNIERINEYYSISILDTGKLYDDIGLPLLPVKTARILIPQGHDVKTINIIPGKKITLEGEFRIEYAKSQIPSGSDETIETQPNRQVYSSSNPYPGKFFSVVSSQFLCGYKILVLNLFPVEYIPASGKVSYYKEMKVIVVNVPSEPSRMRKAKCRNLPHDNARVKRLVDNPFEISTYARKVALMQEEPIYDYVIITNNEMTGAFQTLANWRASKGFTTYVETVENIEANYSGSDLQEKIRNFISYAYDNWGTVYVLLGGDGDARRGRWGSSIIPCRGVYGEAFTKTYIDEDIPCDMYYAALDGNWDNDGDGIYGEGDESAGGTGSAGDEADFLAEVYVGRIPADNATEAYNQIDKIIAYESSLHWPTVLLVGRQWDDPTYGGDYKDEVYDYSFPPDWAPTTLYEMDGTYSQIKLINEMNSNNHHVVNHAGHSGYLNDMGLSHDQIVGLINTKYFLAYSQGCNAGGIDTVNLKTDCAGELFTVENGNGGAFAYIGNSRLGFYLSGSLDGASQQYDKEFFDAIFNEPIVNIGIAFQDSKENLQGSVGATGAIRWCYFGLCLLGDPATPFSETTTPEIDETPPADVTNLATGDTTANSIDLTWTAPGDDGMDGTASLYDIRYSTSEITGVNWDTAVECINEPSPSSGGTLESFTVAGLSPNTTYYFALKTADEVPNWSGLSNSPNGTTEDAGPQIMYVSAIDMSLKAAGPNVNAIATVIIVDTNGMPVSGATVSGHWSGATSDTDSGVTESNGKVTFKSDRLRNPAFGTTFTFTVDDVEKDGWTYDSSRNVETSDSITY